MPDRPAELDDVELEDLRPITLGPIATQEGNPQKGLTEEDWWFHLYFDNLWFKSCAS